MRTGKTIAAAGAAATAAVGGATTGSGTLFVAATASGFVQQRVPHVPQPEKNIMPASNKNGVNTSADKPILFFIFLGGGRDDHFGNGIFDFHHQH